MLSKNIKILTAMALTSMALVAVGVAASQSTYLKVNADTCIHNGNHYTALVPTDVESGTKEYWICCSCHEHYLTKPETGTWAEAGIAAKVDEADDRYWAFDNRTELEKELDELGFKYTINGDSVTITGYDGDPNVYIPEGVTNIAAGAFKDKDLSVVVLPSTIKKVEGNAFKDSGYAVSSRGGDDFVIYVNMTKKEFDKLRNSDSWNNAYDESPWGWGLIGTETVKAEVVYLPNWHYVGGIPTKK